LICGQAAVDRVEREKSQAITSMTNRSGTISTVLALYLLKVTMDFAK
jgi:hypothetical protein